MGGAVFTDVEGTLVDGSLPRISLEIGRKMGVFPRWKIWELGAISLATKLLPGERRRRARFLIIKRAMVGRSEPEILQLCEAMVPAVLARIKVGQMARLRRHKEDGLPLVLMSAGLHEVIARLGTELGGRGEGTRFVKQDGKYLAKFDGAPCEGEGKAARAQAVMQEWDCDPALCYGYGDTAGDIPFLALFGHPHAVDPDEGLQQEAKKRGWPILEGRSGKE